MMSFSSKRVDVGTLQSIGEEQPGANQLLQMIRLAAVIVKPDFMGIILLLVAREHKQIQRAHRAHPCGAQLKCHLRIFLPAAGHACIFYMETANSGAPAHRDLNIHLAAHAARQIINSEQGHGRRGGRCCSGRCSCWGPRGCECGWW